MALCKLFGVLSAAVQQYSHIDGAKDAVPTQNKTCNDTCSLFAVPLAEVTGVTMRTAVQSSTSTLCRQNDGPVLFVHTFRRRSFDWVQVEHALEFAEEAVAEHWLEHIQALLDRLPDRPDRLFVVINPYGGTQRADLVWRDTVKPIFERAHITCDAFRTGYQDHTVELLEQMSWEQFSSYDGIVAIGGDGLFQECLRGVLALRARGDQWRAKAKSIRIAQLPAGSTDAVACTINGCRSAVTAALHVVVGDRALLDVLEVRTQEGQCRYACSAAAYGFIGDVLGRSESMRWMGPMRYDIGGAMALMRLQSYPVRLWFKQPAAPHPVRTICTASCQVCSQPVSHIFDSDIAVQSDEQGAEERDEVCSLHAEAQRAGSGDAGNAAACRTSVSKADPPAAQPAAAPVPRAPRRNLHMRCASGFAEPDTRPTVTSTAAAFIAPTTSAHTLPPVPSLRASSAGDGTPSVTSRQPSALSLPAPADRTDSTSSAAAPPVEGWFDQLPVESDSGSGSSSDDSRWRCWEGEITSLMVVVTPTRSDKAKGGIVPHAHLSDGRLHLIIVRKCTRAQFLRFLVSLSRGGVDERFDFVEVKEVEAWRLEELAPGARSSQWNVDGELMQTGFISARCHHGLVSVFGRGPECHEATGKASSSGAASAAAAASEGAVAAK